MEGENPDTLHAKEAGHWYRVYSDLVALKTDAVRREASGHREAAVDSAWQGSTRTLEVQLESCQAGLDYWQSRLQVLNEVLLDDNARSLCFRTREVCFTTREYQLLSFLVRHVDHVFSAERLLAEAWHRSDLGPEQVRLYVSQVRRKLDFKGAPVEVVTSPRKGYFARLA